MYLGYAVDRYTSLPALESGQDEAVGAGAVADTPRPYHPPLRHVTQDQLAVGRGLQEGRNIVLPPVAATDGWHSQRRHHFATGDAAFRVIKGAVEKGELQAE